MKRVLLIILLHLSLFFIVFAYQAQADDEEWYVNDFGTFVVAAVSGEVVHGDKLRFFIKKEDCSKVAMMFSFSTNLRKDEIKELKDKKLPIRINDWDTIRGARVIYVHPFELWPLSWCKHQGFTKLKSLLVL